MTRSPKTPLKPPAKKPRKKAAPKLPPELPPELPPLPSTVIEAVRRHVDGLPQSLKGSALAVTALHLAEVLTSTSAARDAATLAKELRACLEDLTKAQSLAVDKADAVDEIKAARDKRRAKAGM